MEKTNNANPIAHQQRVDIIRRAVDFSKKVDASFKVKIAETQTEFEQAFRLVHEAYSQVGFLAYEENKMHVIPYHALPSTCVIIAKIEDEVVGTLTIVRDNRLGLPYEKIFSLESIRRERETFAEITCLAVKDSFRSAQNGMIFPYLMKYAYEFSSNYFGVDHLVAVIHPKDTIYYEGLLCFKVIHNEPIIYMGAPAIGVHLDMKNAKENFTQIYRHLPEKNNLYNFFAKRTENLVFPKRLFSEIDYPGIRKEWYSFFFNDMVLPQELMARSEDSRYKRIEVKTTGRLFSEMDSFNPITDVEILNVSVDGLKIYSAQELGLYDCYWLEVNLTESKKCQLLIAPKWKNQRGEYGFAIVFNSLEWRSTVLSFFERYGG